MQFGLCANSTPMTLKELEEGDKKERDDLLVTRLTKQNELYEKNLRLRLWEIGVPAFATFACIACLYWCESCLLGVMLFCALLCCKDWVLVLVFVTSLLLFISRHPLDTQTVHHLTNAAIELARTE